MQLRQLAKNVLVIDLAASGLVSAGHVGDVDQPNVIDVLLEFLNEIAFSNLLVKKIVKKLHLRMLHRADAIKSSRPGGKKVLWILFWTDIFEQQAYRATVALLTFHDCGGSLEAVNAALLLGFNRHSLNCVSG